MSDADIARTGLAQAAAHFPGAEPTLRRLALSQPKFRDLCEEYALARRSLAGLEALPDAAERSEIGDYHTVIAELEIEIGRYLAEAGEG